MIVRQFISWIRTAPAGERAEATRALARAWLISDLTEDDRIAAEGALLMLLDDPSPLVRQAMADVFARSPDAPATIVRALAADSTPEQTIRRMDAIGTARERLAGNVAPLLAMEAMAVALRPQG